MKKELSNKDREMTEIPTILYSQLVRALSYKIEYHDRINRVLEFMDSLDSLDQEQFWYVQQILKGEI